MNTMRCLWLNYRFKGEEEVKKKQKRKRRKTKLVSYQSVYYGCVPPTQVNTPMNAYSMMVLMLFWFLFLFYFLDF